MLEELGEENVYGTMLTEPKKPGPGTIETWFYNYTQIQS